jgi:hypothetical protein
MEWLLPNKYENETGVDGWMGLLSLIGAIAFGVFTFLAIKHNGLFDIASLILLPMFGFTLLCLYVFRDRYYQQKEDFKKKESKYGRLFNSWSEIWKLERDAEAKRKLELERRIDDQKWNSLGSKDDLERNVQEISDNYLYLFDGMPKVKTQVRDEGVNEGGANVPSSAYAFGSDRFVVKKFAAEGERGALNWIILHEMTHNWINWKGIKMEDSHGQQFQDKFEQVKKEAGL